MGRLGYGTVEGLVAFTNLTDLVAAEEAVQQAYIDRAEAWIDRHGPFYTSEPGWVEDVTTAIYKVTEYLWLRSSAAFKSALTSIFQSEKIGTYQYTKPSGAASITINLAEMDDELASFFAAYMQDDTLIISTIIFKELPESLVTGKRDYVDASDLVFDMAQDYGIRSGSSASRLIR